ncbi:hypothetical protein [Rummeliibacillus sp. BSL5]
MGNVLKSMESLGGNVKAAAGAVMDWLRLLPIKGNIKEKYYLDH